MNKHLLLILLGFGIVGCTTTDGKLALNPYSMEVSHNVPWWIGEKIVQNYEDITLKHKAMAIRVGVGLERTENGGDAIRAIAALPALTGAWKVVGGGIFQNPQGTFPINRKALTNANLVEENRNVINLFLDSKMRSPFEISNMDVMLSVYGDFI